MIKEKIENDKVAKFLVQNSSLSLIQADTYLIERVLFDKNLDLKTSKRDAKKVSKGSYLRTLKQARNNLEKAIYTLILAEYMNFINIGSIEKIIQVSKLLQNIKSIDNNKINDIIHTINFIVKSLSGNHI